MMFIFRSVLLGVLFYCFSAENISFKNVTIHWYSSFTHKFKKVIISSNSLKNEISKSIFDAIEMKGQDIPVLYENCIRDIEKLDELILEENGIQEIQPGAMKNLESIRLIKLKGNKLQKIEAGVFNDLPVSDIDLSKNEISVIEENAFDNMPDLLNIRLTDNKITKWNKNWFVNTPLLTRVSFQHNLIEDLPPEAFKNLGGVKKYGKVPLTLNLIFSYNKLKTLHSETFMGLQEINNLWLDNNLIKELPAQLFKGVSIRNLKLSSNKLTCIEDKDGILKAEMNDIDANPFECKCMENIKKWSEEKNKTITFFYSDMNCYANRLEAKMRHIENLLRQMKDTQNNNVIGADPKVQ